MPMRVYGTKVQYRNPVVSPSLMAGVGEYTCIHATGLFTMVKAKPFIVVVDDDESVSRAIMRLLRSIGVASESFSSGDAFLEALSSVPSYQPACVILDVQMPGLNGLEVQRRLAGTGMPIIFITAHDEVGVRQQALAAGALAYLRKPFGDELLIKTVRAILGTS
jgi:FixJ family two-component response regulator